MTETSFFYFANTTHAINGAERCRRLATNPEADHEIIKAEGRREALQEIARTQQNRALVQHFARSRSQSKSNRIGH
jgi:hypothetical protein